MKPLRSFLFAAVAVAVGVSFAAVGSDRLHAAEAGAALGTGDSAIGAQATGGNGGEPVDPTSASRAATGTCNTARTAYATDANAVVSLPTSFAVLPSLQRTITIPGTAPRCVIIEFIGEVATGAGGTLIIRGRIPGVGNSLTPEMSLAYNASIWETRTVRFIFPSVPAGQRTVRIDWRSFGGQAVYARLRTMIVYF